MPAVTAVLTSAEFITDYVTTDVSDLDNSTMNGTIAFTEGIEMTTYSDLNFTGAESNETTMVMTTMDMLFTTVFDNTTIPDEPVPADCDTLCFFFFFFVWRLFYHSWAWPLLEVLCTIFFVIGRQK